MVRFVREERGSFGQPTILAAAPGPLTNGGFEGGETGG